MSDTELETKVREDELTIDCLDQHQHILHRPGMYIGSDKKNRNSSYIWVVKDGKIVENVDEIEKCDSNGKPKLNPDGSVKVVKEKVGPLVTEGFIRIFVEIVSNAIDNVWRSREFGIKAKEIRFTYDKEGVLSVENDGKPLIHGIHPTENKHNIELIFSRLLTSTNYDDSRDRKTSGTNGYGAKLTNIYSKWFQVESYNNESKTMYTQKWKNNMYEREEPTIKKKERGSNFTRITWLPDYKRFGMKNFDNEVKKVITKFLYDTAMIVSKDKVKVYINEEVIELSSLEDYAKLYFIEELEELIAFKSNDSNVLLIPHDGYLPISFINGMCTPDGGLHVDSWANALFRTIANKMNGIKEGEKKTKEQKEKDKKKTVYTADHVKNHFAIFVVSEVSKPVFSNQNKTKFSGTIDNKPIDVNIKSSDFTKIMKWNVIDRIKQMVQAKELTNLNTKKRNFIKIDGFDDANSPDRMNCIFCVTEGDSAKTFVVSGMKYGLISRSGEIVKGRDYIAVLAMRGKFINPNGKEIKKVAANKEVSSIIQILNLRTNIDYTEEENFKTLRFGRFMVFADSDDDGNHIVGLLYNFFNCLYPSLLKVPGFFFFNKNPIITIQHKKNDELAFYYQEKAKQFLLEEKINKRFIKYYKGLGTFGDKDVKKYFGKRPAEIMNDKDTEKTIELAFGKKQEHINYRKNLVNNFDSSKLLLTETKDGEIEKVEFGNYLINELAEYGVKSCKRAIPKLHDGLNDSQRKIIFCIRKRKLTYTKKSLKVAQLGAYVAENTLYAHGEKNLGDTIKGLGQRFVGSNNLPFLYNDGQFGTRLQNGKDGADQRYIFTKGEIYFDEVFNQDDDDYLVNLEEESQEIEKEHYLPVVCTLLCNGSNNIGFGWSSNIPQYNPLVVADWQIEWIKTGGNLFKKSEGSFISYGPELIPWYRAFKGKIENVGNNFVSYGVVEEAGKGKKRITEIPIGMSIDQMKEQLDDLVEKKVIKGYDNHSDQLHVNYLVNECADGLDVNVESLGLKTNINTSNMVVFINDKCVKKFDFPEEILHEYCMERMKLYETRHTGNIKKKENELEFVRNKIRFINEITSEEEDKLIIKNVSDEDLYKEMDRRGYKRKFEEKKRKNEEEDDEENTEEDPEEQLPNGNFNYLLCMQIRGATKKKMELLRNEEKNLEKEIKEMKAKKPSDVWIEEIQKFKGVYSKWLKSMEESEREEEIKEKPEKKKVRK